MTVLCVKNFTRCKLPSRGRVSRVNCSERRAGGSTPISFKENAVQNPLFTLNRYVRGPNFRTVLFWFGTNARRTTFGLGTASDRLGTDRHRSRQRTATIGVFGFATVYLVRHALAGIERATCWTDRLAVRTASCGSRRERFAARRVGEHVSFDVSLCTSCQS